MHRTPSKTVSTIRRVAPAFLLPLFMSPLMSPIPSRAETGPARAGTAAKPNARSLELNEKAVRLVNERKFREAEEAFRASLAADPMNLTAAFNLAGMYMQNRKEPFAIDLLSRYAKDAPDDLGLRARLGDAYFANKNVEAALKEYEAVFTTNPGYPGIAARLGTIYGMKNRLPDSERVLMKAAELDPKNGQLLANLASILLANGKPNEAIAAAKRSLQVQPTSEVYITLGNAYEAVKDLKNSLIAFERARDLGDARPELADRIERLKKVA